MRIAVISDIHANKEALDAVIESIEKHSINKMYCLGDLVGYGVEPKYCIDTVKEIFDVCLKGNHDHVASKGDGYSQFNSDAQVSAKWTSKNILKKHKMYLGNLELTSSLEKMFFVHSTPDKPEQWKYISNALQAGRQFPYFDGKICFVGHAHIPGLYTVDGYDRMYREGLIFLDKTKRYIVNVGSVGQPRDMDPRACYVIYDEDWGTIEFVRILYDVYRASKKIAEAGISEFNAKRILVGR